LVLSEVDREGNGRAVEEPVQCGNIVRRAARRQEPESKKSALRAARFLV